MRFKNIILLGQTRNKSYSLIKTAETYQTRIQNPLFFVLLLHWISIKNNIEE